MKSQGVYGYSVKERNSGTNKSVCPQTVDIKGNWAGQYLEVCDVYCSWVGERNPSEAMPEAEHSLLPIPVLPSYPVPQYSYLGIWELLTQYSLEAGTYFPLKEIQISPHQAGRASELCFAKLSCVVLLSVLRPLNISGMLFCSAVLFCQGIMWHYPLSIYLPLYTMVPSKVCNSCCYC